MPEVALKTGFLTDIQQHWPFPTALIDCTLVQAGFNQHALSPELFEHYAIAVPHGASKRQAEFLAARLCARQALQRQTGHAQVPTQQADTRIPVWPMHSCGSMTHSHARCAAIVGLQSKWHSLGLDLERLIPIARAQRLAKTILTQAEYTAYCRLDPAQQAWHLTLAFSLKESLFKALNPLTGMYFGFHDAQIIDTERHTTGHARLRLNKTLSTHWTAGRELEGQFVQLDNSLLTLIGISSEQNSATVTTPMAL